MRRKITSTIEKPNAGMRLDVWLSSRFDYHSRNKWQELIRNEEVIVNNKKARPSKTLAENDVVELKTNEGNEPDSNTNYSIIYEDENLIAVNKPADLPCHPSGAYFHKTLWYLIVNDLKIKVHIVHRLDRETSGVVLMAKKSGYGQRVVAFVSDKANTKNIYRGSSRFISKKISCHRLS